MSTSTPSPGQRVMKHGEILNVLRNSPKGQLRYDTGWDEKPYAVPQLISAVQLEVDAEKHCVLTNAIRVMRLSEETKLLMREQSDDASSVGTSSGSGSHVTLSENGINRQNSQDEDVTDSRRCSSCKKGYGIRDEDYDDKQMEEEFQLHQLTDSINHVQMCLEFSNKEIMKKAEKESRKWKTKFVEGLEKHLSTLPAFDEAALIAEHIKQHKQLEDEKEAIIQAEMKAIDDVWQKENEIIEQEYDKKKQQLRQRKAKESAVTAARAAAIKAAEERERLLKAQQERDAAATAAAESEAVKQRQAQEEAKKEQQRLVEEAAVARDKKAEAERLLKESQQAGSIPDALRGLILKSDCDKYSHFAELITKYEMMTQMIAASSSDPNIKKFYSGASRCINTPLNAVADTDPHQIVLKTAHFVDLIEGKPVTGSAAMTVPFSSSTYPNGKDFVLKLLAFRFVKKAESEILSEKKGFVPLATIALSISKKFPEWATLVQAYFYKLCPFLVPFSFPRKDQSIQEYCQALGYDIKGEDSTLMTELINRIKGYCSFYAIMVQTYERGGPFDFGEATSFFTISAVWEILSKTLRLEPQPDVTVIVIQTFLEILSDRLLAAYGSQFKKLMIVLSTVYLPKISQVSTGASQSSVSRFQTFLEQNFSNRR